MFGRSKTEAALETARPYAEELANDEKLRNRLAAALAHASEAARRAQRYRGATGFARRLATDDELQEHVRQLARELGRARNRVERRRLRSRRMLLVLLGGAGVAVIAVPQSRSWLKRQLGGGFGWQTSGLTTIEAGIDVNVPLETVYNQWTQFEDFPLFMEGVEDVRQLGPTTLHWIAKVGGKRAEWDAKILDQEPDRRIVWESTDGKQTRGTVTFLRLDPERTRVTLSMSYKPEGAIEQAGSAMGLDERRVRDDLERFKHYIESRGVETGAWRSEVRSGQEV